MRKGFPIHLLLVLFVQLLCITDRGFGQLHIGSGTKWMSNSQTTVVLNELDLQYDADPIVLGNIFRFTGTRNNSISGKTQPKIYAISLAKTNPGQLSLNQSIRVTKRINFESGLFDLNGNGITLDTAALLTNENENSRLIGPSPGGYISIDANISVAGGPVNPGNLGAYITTAVDLGVTNIARGHDRQHISDTSLGIARWYELSVPDIREPSSTLRFYYFLAEASGLKTDSLVLWKGYDFSGWTNLGFTARNTAEKYVEKKQLTSLHRFTLYPSQDTSAVTPPPPNPLPGTVILFGAWNGNNALLNWMTSKEVNNDHFTVERKYAGETGYPAIASLPSKVPGGSSDTATHYSYTDSAVSTGKGVVSYRIHQVGKGGESTYSNIITLTPAAASTVIRKLFPTVATGGRIYIQVGNLTLSNMQFKIFDWAGHCVMSGTLPYQSQWISVVLLHHGAYRLLLQSGSQRFSGTFIK